jgi:hypothetical protein
MVVSMSTLISCPTGYTADPLPYSVLVTNNSPTPHMCELLVYVCRKVEGNGQVDIYIDHLDFSQSCMEGFTWTAGMWDQIFAQMLDGELLDKSKLPPCDHPEIVQVIKFFKAVCWTYTYDPNKPIDQSITMGPCGDLTDYVNCTETYTVCYNTHTFQYEWHLLNVVSLVDGTCTTTPMVIHIPNPGVPFQGLCYSTCY